jgi:hypothetical protein
MPRKKPSPRRPRLITEARTTTAEIEAAAHASTQVSAAFDVELERIVDMREAERLSTLSEDTLKRRFPDKIIRLSKRRLGMRVRHALMLAERGEP